MRVLLALSLLIAAAAATPALAWEPAAGSQGQLRAGQVVIDVTGQPDGSGLIHAAINIGAPPKLVWQVMVDCRETPKLIASADPCRVLSSDPGGTWDVREQLTHGNVLVPDIRNVYRSDYQPFSLIRFHRVGGDLKIEEGEWRLVALDGGRSTQVIYVNRLAANILAPAFMVRNGLRDSTPKVLQNLRRECLAREGR